MNNQEKKIGLCDEPIFRVDSMARSDTSGDAGKELLELQLKMATSSINHEYARIEFDDTEDRERREDLLEYMHDCRCQYFEARSELASYDPYALAEFEADLMRQKMSTMARYSA